MKPKKQKKKMWPWVLVIGIILAIFGFTMYVQYDNYRAQQKVNYEEDIKFAKIESYVDLIKARLDREIPEGKWEVTKSCDKPGTKGDFEAYSCSYGITASVKANYYDKTAAILQDYSVKDISKDRNEINNIDQISTYPAGLLHGCGYYFSRESNNNFFTCDDSSHRIRYTLID